MMVIQNLAEKVVIQIQAGCHAHILYKPFKRLLLHNQWANLAHICRKHMGHLPL